MKNTFICMQTVCKLRVESGWTDSGFPLYQLTREMQICTTLECEAYYLLVEDHGIIVCLFVVRLDLI